MIHINIYVEKETKLFWNYRSDVFSRKSKIDQN